MLTDLDQGHARPRPRALPRRAVRRAFGVEWNRRDRGRARRRPGDDLGPGARALARRHGRRVAHAPPPRAADARRRRRSRDELAGSRAGPRGAARPAGARDRVSGRAARSRTSARIRKAVAAAGYEIGLSNASGATRIWPTPMRGDDADRSVRRPPAVDRPRDVRRDVLHAGRGAAARLYRPARPRLAKTGSARVAASENFRMQQILAATVPASMSKRCAGRSSATARPAALVVDLSTDGARLERPYLGGRIAARGAAPARGARHRRGDVGASGDVVFDQLVPTRPRRRPVRPDAPHRLSDRDRRGARPAPAPRLRLRDASLAASASPSSRSRAATCAASDRALRVEREVRVDHAVGAVALERDLARPRAHRARARRDRAASVPSAARSAASSTGTSRPVSPSSTTLGQAADRGRDDRQPGRHRLGHDERQALGLRRQREHVERRHEPRHVHAAAGHHDPARLGQRRDRGLDARARVGPSPTITSRTRDDSSGAIARTSSAWFLYVVEPADRADDPRIAEAELDARRGARLGIGVIAIEPDAVRDRVHAARAARRAARAPAASVVSETATNACVELRGRAPQQAVAAPSPG